MSLKYFESGACVVAVCTIGMVYLNCLLAIT